MSKLPNVLFYALSTLVLCVIFTGCAPVEKVETYTVERTSPPRQPLDVDVLLQQLDHTLVAIVPQNDQAWFFKLVGKAPAIERQRRSFNDFLASVKLAESSLQMPSWNLPDDWKKGEAKEMRLATLLVPDADGELELAITSLPLSGEWEDFLVPNVTRWLGQLQRPPLSKETVLKLAQQKSIENGNATVFELSGTMAQRPTMGNPHAGLGIAPPSTSSSQPTAKAKPAGEQPLTYDTPEGWLPGKMSMMRKAAFLLPGGERSDQVTVTSFPDNAQMGEVAANIQRWAGQVGLTPPTGDALDKLTEPISVDGIEGTYVELTSPTDSARSVALYAAMIKRDGQVWFFKMSGKSELVSGQRAAFREFLQSVRFQ